LWSVVRFASGTPRQREGEVQHPRLVWVIPVDPAVQPFYSLRPLVRQRRDD
jgi:hypothetical protein